MYICLVFEINPYSSTYMSQNLFFEQTYPIVMCLSIIALGSKHNQVDICWSLHPKKKNLSKWVFIFSH
jgi:hypothetical protein